MVTRKVEQKNAKKKKFCPKILGHQGDTGVGDRLAKQWILRKQVTGIDGGVQNSS